MSKGASLEKQEMRTWLSKKERNELRSGVVSGETKEVMKRKP